MIFCLVSCASKNYISQNYENIKADQFLDSQVKQTCNEKTEIKIDGLLSKLNKTSDVDARVSLWYQLGNCYCVNQDFLLGTYFYSLFITANVDDREKKSKVLANMGVMMDFKNQKFMALEYYNKAIKLNPKNLGAIYLKGIFLIKTGEYEEAKRVFNYLVRYYPRSRVLRSAQAVTFFLSSDLKSLRDKVLIFLDDKEKEIFSLSIALKSKSATSKVVERLEGLHSDINFVNEFKEAILFNLENDESFKN